MRIIHNTSFIIDEKIEKEWSEFMKHHCVRPLRERYGCDDILFTKVSIDQPEGKTYSLQVIFRTEDRRRRFLENGQPFLEKTLQKYTGRYVCFSSILTEI